METGSTDYWYVIEPYWDRFDMSDEATFHHSLATLPEPVAELLCIHWLSSEVANGGFQQFFTNSTGIVAPEALDALKKLGLFDLHKIGKEALGYLPSPYPRSRRERMRLMNARLGPDAAQQSAKKWDVLNELNDRFYASAEFEQLRSRMDDYAARARDK